MSATPSCCYESHTTSLVFHLYHHDTLRASFFDHCHFHRVFLLSSGFYPWYGNLFLDAWFRLEINATVGTNLFGKLKCLAWPIMLLRRTWLCLQSIYIYRRPTISFNCTFVTVIPASLSSFRHRYHYQHPPRCPFALQPWISSALLLSICINCVPKFSNSCSFSSTFNSKGFELRH